MFSPLTNPFPKEPPAGGPNCHEVQALAEAGQVAKREGVELTESMLLVFIGSQSVSWLRRESSSGNSEYTVVKRMRASTSKFGIGSVEGSNCTPLGLHKIEEKIGAGEPLGTVFKGRKPVGLLSQGMPEGSIVHRILWLAGLEPGKNQGGNLDTHARYIYIHGFWDETTLGTPMSHGCVHLAAEDLLPLFDQVESGTLVWISEGSGLKRLND